MRAGLQLTCAQGFDTIRLVGNVARKTNATAVKSIMQNGLRNDFNEKGERQGRTGVMADPWGHGDRRENLYMQCEKGNVRVLMSITQWWNLFGTHYYDRPRCGVRVFVAGSGVLLFANVNPYIAAVLPIGVLAKVMMRYPVNDASARTMRASGVRDPDDPMCGSDRTMQACRRGWFSIFSRPLADESLPPADAQIRIRGEQEDVCYQFVNTIGDIDTPQMGVENDLPGMVVRFRRAIVESHGQPGRQAHA
jgi:hypothetical protein